MIVDIHTHIFPDKIAAAAISKLSAASGILPNTDGTTRGLLDSMDRAGVDLSVILPVATAKEQVDKINSSAMRLNEAYAEKGLFSFGAMHPDYGGGIRRELNRLRENGIKGIKIHPVYQSTDIDDIKYLRIFDCAAELNMTVVTHAGLDIGFPDAVHCSPTQILRAMRQIGDFKFVLAHMGGWQNWEEAQEIFADTKVYIDTAFSFGKFNSTPAGKDKNDKIKMLNEDALMKFVKIFGAERILFGTDSPWAEQKEAVNFIKNSPLADADKEKILGGNAQKLLS